MSKGTNNGSSDAVREKAAVITVGFKMIFCNAPLCEVWLNTASRHADADNFSQGLMRKALSDQPASSRPATNAVITAVTEACMSDPGCSMITPKPAFFRRLATSRQVSFLPVSGMPSGERKKLMPPGCPPPAWGPPCQAMNVVPPKITRSSAPSGKNSGRPPSGAKQTTRSDGTCCRNSLNQDE